MALKTFKRYELKFLINNSQYEKLKEIAKDYMEVDKYGQSDICSLYYDTSDYLLIRRSIEKPIYKEKLRVRSYGLSKEDSNVYLELKKKYKSIVYKRRIELKEKDINDYILGNKIIDSQISKEIQYFLKFYKDLSPKVFLSYKREAYYGIFDKDLRITFDSNILWRDYDLSLKEGFYGNSLLEPKTYLMEIKTEFSIPLWLSDFLTQEKIYKTSFSKYGKAYLSILEKKLLGEKKYVG